MIRISKIPLHRPLQSVRFTVNAQIQRRFLNIEPMKVEDLKSGKYNRSLYFALSMTIGLVAFNYVYFEHFHEPPIYRLTADKFFPFKLIEKLDMTHDTALFRFEAFVPEAATSALPIPSHVIVKDDSCQIGRAYSPITYSTNGFDLLVKKYENGSVSKLIHDLKTGESLSVSGPVWSFPYESNMADEIGMVGLAESIECKTDQVDCRRHWNHANVPINQEDSS
jgi:hypothetical protein